MHIFWQFHTSQLKLSQFLVDFRDFEGVPCQFQIPIDLLVHQHIQRIQFAQQIEFFFPLMQDWVVGDFQAEEFLTTFVGFVLIPELIEARLKKEHLFTSNM